jgi:hypothetical protein
MAKLPTFFRRFASNIETLFSSASFHSLVARPPLQATVEAQCTRENAMSSGHAVHRTINIARKHRSIDFRFSPVRAAQSVSLFRFRISCLFRPGAPGSTFGFPICSLPPLRPRRPPWLNCRRRQSGRGRKLQTASNSRVAIPLAERLFFQAFCFGTATASGDTFITRKKARPEIPQKTGPEKDASSL